MISDLSKPQIEGLLHSQPIGRLGCRQGDKVYVVPIGFVYADGDIFAHSGLGMKIEYMRESPKVCFEVERVKDMGNWDSAILWGTFQELENGEAEKAIRLLVAKLSPLEPYSDAGPSDGPDGASTRHVLDRSTRHGIVFRIHIEEMTGRSERR